MCQREISKGQAAKLKSERKSQSWVMTWPERKNAISFPSFERTFPSYINKGLDASTEGHQELPSPEDPSRLRSCQYTKKQSVLLVWHGCSWTKVSQYKGKSVTSHALERHFSKVEYIKMTSEARQDKRPKEK